MVPKLYRAALYLYPAAFRREFSSEMTRDFQEATREAGPGRARLMVWAGIGAAVLGFNLLGDALRDALDPRAVRSSMPRVDIPRP